MKISVFIGLIFLCLANSILAQSMQNILDRRVDYWLDKNKTESGDLSQIQEIWEFYSENPLDINTVTKEELLQLDMLNEVQIQELLIHRSKYGNFLSLLELQTLNSWDTNTIQLLLPFITLRDQSGNPPLSMYEITKNGRFEVMTRFQHPLRVPEVTQNVSAKFLGNNDYYLIRMRYHYAQRLSVGITTEKDVGESFLSGVNKNGFDFYSFHFHIKPQTLVKQIVFGDYHIQIGQGLNCWTSFALGKSLDLTSSKKNAQVIRPHSSTEENRFLRGVASELNFKRFSVVLFASKDRKDATIFPDTILQVSSLLSSGYHRTKSEIAQKDLLSEMVLGGYVNYTKGAFHLGFASVKFNYSSSFTPFETAYNSFDFRGKHFQSSSVDYSYTFRNALFFGEVSYVNFSSKMAVLSGCMLALDAKNSVCFLYRNYDKGYQTTYNSGFSEGNTVQNESGIYIAYTGKFGKSWHLQMYSDFFQYPWLKFQVNLPSSGFENCAQITYTPSKFVELYVRYRDRYTQQNDPNIVNGLKGLIFVNQSNIRIHLMCKINESIELRSRIEGVSLIKENTTHEKGMVFYQDICFENKIKTKQLIFRFMLYDIDSYASRIYCYESSPLYQYSSPAFYGKGVRAYLLLKFNFWKKLDCWFRFGANNFVSPNTIYSNTSIPLLNAKKEINIQLRLKL